MALPDPQAPSFTNIIDNSISLRIITEICKNLRELVGEFKHGGSKEKTRKLVKVIENLGIDSEGKTKEEFLEEIKRKLFA